MIRKVAVIGCGMIAGAAHIPAYQRLPESFRVEAVCDPREQAARETAERFHIPRRYTDPLRMLQEVKPDLVSVCSPNGLHKEHTLAALEAGAHVLCEKPVALTYRDAAEMYDAAARKGLLLEACQCWRYIPERMAARRLIEAGEMGDIYYAEMTHIRRRGIPTWGKFHIRSFSGGGAFADIGVHVLDSALWLMGNPRATAVSATMGKVHAEETGSLKGSGAFGGVTHARPFDPKEMDVESFSCGTVRFDTGAALQFKVAWAANLAEENTLRLAGTGCGLDTEKGCVYRGEAETLPLATEPNRFPEEPFYGHFYLIENLAEALAGRAPLMVRPEETVQTAAVIEAAYRSAALGREVAMGEIYGQ